MNYTQLKKLDEETLEKLTEGTGPSDKCLCSLLAPPEEGGKKGFGASIKKAFASLGGGKQNKKAVYEPNSVDIPLTYTKGGPGIFTTKEVVKRKSPCGKCGCDSENFVLKHSYANIRITAPDVDMASICPCPSNCLPDLKEKLQSNIKVTIEHVSVLDAATPDAISAVTEDSVSTSKGSEPTLPRSKEPSEPILPRSEQPSDHNLPKS